MPKLEITQLTSSVSGGAIGYQSQLPDTGGGAIAQSLINAGSKLSGIANKLIDIKVKNEVAEAGLAATLGLNKLSVDLGNQGHAAVEAGFDPGAQEIFKQISPNMSPAAAQSFKTKWNTLVAQNYISAKSAGITRDQAHEVGKALTILDGFSRGITIDDAGNRVGVDPDVALSEGVGLIDGLLTSNAIDGKQHAKMTIKFKRDISVGAVTRWITQNAGSFKTMGLLQKEIVEGNISDPVVAKHWAGLGPKAQEAIRIKLRTARRNLAAASDRADKEINLKAEGEAANAKLKFHDLFKEPYSQERTNKLNQILKYLGTLVSSNPSANIITRSEYATMQALVRTGGESGQRIPHEYERWQYNVTTGRATESQIWAAKGLTTEDKNELVNKLDAHKDRAVDRALNILKTEEAFIPKGLSRLNIQELTRQQARVANQFYRARSTALKEKKAFDAEGVMIDLIDKYKKTLSQDATKLLEEQQSSLSDLGISNWDEYHAYINQNRRRLSSDAGNKLRRAANVVFGPERRQR